jgi:hypothetical protein
MGQLRWSRIPALAGATALVAALGCAVSAQASPGLPGAVVPSGFTALDPCPSAAPCPPKVTVAWGPASWSQHALLQRRYVLEPMSGDLGLGGALRETNSNLVTLDVAQPADGRLFRFRVFGRETELVIADRFREIPVEVVIPDWIRNRPALVPGIRTAVQFVVFPEPVLRQPVFTPPEPVLIDPQLVAVFDPNSPDGPAVAGEFRIDASAPSPSISQSATHIGAGESVTLNAKAADPPSGSAPGSGVDPAGYAWNFGDGATGSGPAVEHRYGEAGSYSGALAVRDKAGNTARQAFTVKVSPVTTDGVAAASAPTGGAKKTRIGGRARISGAVALRALGISLRQPVLRAVWRESRLRGAVILGGTSARRVRLKMRLRAPGLEPLELGALPLGGGRFSIRVALPAGIVPGGLTIDLTQGSRTPARIRLRVPSPAEGVARTAFASSSRLGGPLAGLSASSRAIFARFSLAALPASGRPLTVTWYQPNGQVAGHPVRKPRSRALTSFVRSTEALPPGTWRAVLRAGSVRVAQIAVRVG